MIWMIWMAHREILSSAVSQGGMEGMTEDCLRRPFRIEAPAFLPHNCGLQADTAAVLAYFRYFGNYSTWRLLLHPEVLAKILPGFPFGKGSMENHGGRGD